MGVVDHHTRFIRSCQRLRQYSKYVVGRILGTVGEENGGFKQLREMDECRHYQRVELNALTAMLIEKKVMTADEWIKKLADESCEYEKAVKSQYPEVSPSEEGTSMVLDLVGAQARMRKEGWPP